MSYCRTSSLGGKCDVYLYEDVDGSLYCCGCSLLNGNLKRRSPGMKGRTAGIKYRQENNVRLSTRSAAILHLRHHKLMGHVYPSSAERRLITELRENGESPSSTVKHAYSRYRKDVELFLKSYAEKAGIDINKPDWKRTYRRYVDKALKRIAKK